MQAFATPLALFTCGHGGQALCTRRTKLRATLTPTRATLHPTSVDRSNCMESLSNSDRARILEVRSQIEFWFSSSNLKRDWYLRRQMDEEGWMDPSVFLLFNRIKHLKASLEDIIMACKVSNELQVSEPTNNFGDMAAQTRIRRNPEIVEEDNEMNRSVIVGGFEDGVDIEWIQNKFKGVGIEPVYVKIYRKHGLEPRALVCVESSEVKEKILKEGIEGLDVRRRGERKVVAVCEVSGMSGKMEWRQVLKNTQDLFGEVKYLMYVNGGDKCYVTVGGSGERVAEIEAEEITEVEGEKWKVRRLDGEELEAYWRRAEEMERERREKRNLNVSEGGVGGAEWRPKGVIVKIEGLGEKLNWRDIQGDLGKVGKIVYLNYSPGSGECFARFSNAEEAASVVELLGGDDAMPIGGGQVEARVLDGEEEEGYWERAEEIRRRKG